MVTLVSPYYNGGTHPTNNDSPTSTNATPGNDDLHLVKVLTKLIQIVLWTRLGTDSYRCEKIHHSATDNTQCYLTDPLPSNWDDSEYELKLRIIYKDTLLERWTFRFVPSASPISEHSYCERNYSANIILLLQSVYSHTRLLPVEPLLNQLVLRNTDLDFLATTTETIKPSSGCHSSFANGSQTTIFDTVDDFRPLASVATHSFSAVDCIDIEGQLSLEVVYDETIDKTLFDPNPAQMPDLPPPLPPMQKATCLTGTDIIIPASKGKPTVGSTTPFYKQHIVPASTTSPRPLQDTLPISSTKSYVGTRRLSRLSLSALNNELCNEEISSSLPSEQLQRDPRPFPPLFSTSSIQYTHYGHTLAYLTSPSSNYQQQHQQQHQQQQQQQHQQRRVSLPHHHSLVGSYEESLLSGRMSTLQPSKPIWFRADIGVFGHGHVKSSLRLPPHRSIVFPAYFYDSQENRNMEETFLSIPPYVGTIDLTVDATAAQSRGYRIPSQGQLQVTIKNPHNSLVKLFLVPYDVSSMPLGTKTFLRQKSYTPTRLRSKPSPAEPSSKQDTMTTRTFATTTTTSSSSTAPKYIIHLQICRTNKNKIYIYNKIRVVFANRYLNPNESLVVVYDGPKAPVYSPLQ